MALPEAGTSVNSSSSSSSSSTQTLVCWGRARTQIKIVWESTAVDLSSSEQPVRASRG
jgi:hypothetical protein